MQPKVMPKPLTELTLLNRFLFDEVMDDPENMQILLEIIFSTPVPLKEKPQTEKEFRKSPSNRMVKLDVWAVDENDTVYDTEVQQKNTGNLPKRSRLYQGMIDSSLLQAGTRDFNELNPVCIILIAPFDLFGYGLYRYTFTNRCLEIPEVELDDGATRIFLNTRGTNAEGVSPALIELLHYMEHTNDSGLTFSDEKLRRLQDNVVQTQNDPEVGVKYMQAWEEIAEARDEGYQKGNSDGYKKGASDECAKNIRLMLESGMPLEQVASILKITTNQIQEMLIVE